MGWVRGEDVEAEGGLQSEHLVSRLSRQDLSSSSTDRRSSSTGVVVRKILQRPS